MALPYALRAMSEQSVAAQNGYTHRIRLNATDLTQLVVATAQTFDCAAIPIGAQIQCKIDLRVPFQDVSDAAFNDCALTIGDGTTPNVFLTTTQLNLNGTEVLFKEGSLSAPYVAAGTLRLTMGSMAAKALNDIDVGLLYIYVKFLDLRAMTNLKLDQSTK